VTRPPRLLARTLAVTFITVAVILAVVFIVLTVDVRERVRTSETEKLLVSERVFNSLEARRQQEQLAAIATLAENPALKAALDTYANELRFSGSANEQARATAANEVARLAPLTGADVLAIVDTSGHVFTSAGRLRDQWPADQAITVPDDGQPTFQSVVLLPGGPFRVTGARLRLNDDRDIGALVFGTSLDANYAQELSTLSNAGIVIIVNGAVIARTVPVQATRDLVAMPVGADIRSLNGEEYAVRPLLTSGPARIYTLTSIDAAARTATREAMVALGTVAFGGLVLALLGSIWLARTLTGPIDRVAGAIATMTAARDFKRTIEPTGTSRELDALAGAFNDLMHGLDAAEAETRAAYLGAIRALAAALDARDPYTAGHSERVSAYSVMIGRQMQLGDSEIDVLRLGALLHDIGKIGLADEILRKPGALTAEEFEQIKRHPALGARILRQVPFLAPHLPIVELHHERPDGRGYPFGLRADDIPLAARIVHVADAFDAMTSARAYRPPRPAADAIIELRGHAGTQFDPASVEAFCAALPTSSQAAEPELQELLGRAHA
jgi:putative nucleotidyltransferase with HDIG domain